MAKNKAVFGIYRAQTGIENAVSMLRDESFSSSDVAVLLPESVSSRELGTVKATKAPEGATAGAGSGAVIGGVLGWLAGIGSLAIPGLGPFHRGRSDHGGSGWCGHGRRDGRPRGCVGRHGNPQIRSQEI